MTKFATKVRIAGLTPEDYAAQWGCDGSYDRAPNKLGDGALFYNFGSEIQDRTPEWLTGFLAAIDRTMENVKLNPVSFEANDLQELGELRSYVVGLIPTSDRPDFYKLDDFTRAYIEALLWSTNDESDPETGGDPMDDNYSHADLADETLAKIVADCTKFQADNAADLAIAYERYKRSEWTPEAQAGHDFALTRNRHGAGFWDRGIGDVGNRLTDASHNAREFNLYVGDDGKIYA